MMWTNCAQPFNHHPHRMAPAVTQNYTRLHTCANDFYNFPLAQPATPHAPASHSTVDSPLVSDRQNRRISILACLFACAFAALSFLTGIHWGLPSRAVDPYLFGNQTPWSGDKIVSLAPQESDDRGADVDANPIDRSKGDVILNATDAQRAEIIRRYRLFSYQPDEMITFKSLSRLRQNHGDPRLYQYGGLWIYPVGILLKAASLVGYVDLRSDQAFYLDHPEAFARFYIIARFYSACFGILGAAAVFRIIKKLTGCRVFVPMAGAMCFAMMPGVVNLAHEAKPHLPATALILFAVLAATKFVETGKNKWAVATGALCGAAFGMVISALVAFSIPFVMVYLRHDSQRVKLIALGSALTAGVIVFVLTNPFVLINIIARPERFHSNIQNSTEMYSPSFDGMANACELILRGATPLIAFLAFATLLAEKRLPDLRKRFSPVGWLLLVPAMLTAVIFFALASHKPPEYARFALLFDVLLLVVACSLIAQIRRARVRVLAAVSLAACLTFWAQPYWRGFWRDCDPVTSRLAAADAFAKQWRGGPLTIQLGAEPAPYNVPPLDLFRSRLILTRPDLSTFIIQSPAPNSIGWADVHFNVYQFPNSPRPSAATAVSSKP